MNALLPVTEDDRIPRVLVRMERGESERSACKAEKIDRTTFRINALRQQPGIHYAKALEGLAEAQLAQVEQTIQDMRDGVVDASQARVEIDTRKWFASKFLPKRYGERVQLANDQDNPLIPLQAFDPSEFNEDERAMLRHLAQALIAKRQAALEDQSE